MRNFEPGRQRGHWVVSAAVRRASAAGRQVRRAVRSLDRPARVALLLGLLGAGYRLTLILLTVPGSNSDEATFGLAAAHIAAGDDLPVFLYGQHYMGAVESYLAAPLFTLTGPGWTALRLPLLALYAAFVFLMYRLTRRLYSPWLATLTVGLLALGSERVVRDQVTAVGGRPEVKPAVVAILLLAVALGDRRTGRRWLATGVCGLLAGLCVWDDWLVLPYLAAAGVVLLVATWRDLAGWAGLTLVAGFLLGVAPLVVDNLTAPPGQDTWSVLRQVSGGDVPVPALADRLHGTVLVALPLASGFCPADDCPPVAAWWGPGYLVLLAAAAGLALARLRRGVRYAAQLALVAGAALTLLAYLRNPLSATEPLSSARYLSVLQISLPAVLWPLWSVARRVAGRSTTPVSGRIAALVSGGAAVLLLGALVVAMVAGTASLAGQLATVRDEERQTRELVAELRRAAVTRVYGEYWTCNRLTFMARERTVCAVLTERLAPGQDRYQPYPVRVNAATLPAFVFVAGGPTDTLFRRYLARHGIAAPVADVGRYRVYRPGVPVRPWR